MNSRQRIKAIIARQPADRTGFWLGHPHPDSMPALNAYFGTSSEDGLHDRLGSEMRWVCPQLMTGTYRHPDGRDMFDVGLGDRAAVRKGPPLADCETPADLDAAYEWPNPDYLDFQPVIGGLRAVGDRYRLGGFWTCFYHNLMDLFGMEEYMVKMHTHPEVVLAATDRVCEFYLEANRRLFAVAGGEIDGFFFGNDFGTQLDLICGLHDFDKFIMPWFRRFTDLAHANGYQAVLHSCGAVHRVIDRLIEAGVDCLHPLQARASNMDAAILARDFKGRMTFLGGIDTQHLLVEATPAQVRDEVRRVRDLLGPNLIISPSHEALLPNVPPANVAAMAEAAVE
jgi:uroporphyrinogen decarboxylase